MMFQTNAPALLELRWAFGETVTAPNNGESKSTYQYPPSKSYGNWVWLDPISPPM